MNENELLTKDITSTTVSTINEDAVLSTFIVNGTNILITHVHQGFTELNADTDNDEELSASEKRREKEKRLILEVGITAVLIYGTAYYCKGHLLCMA